jgi:Family of unknown function (DUF6463)
MSIPTSKTTVSANLLMVTGLVHCVFGLAVPELRDPLMRIAAEWAVTPKDNNINDRYERESAFWFQFGGVMMIAQGYLLRQYCVETSRQSPPKWFAWYLTLGSLLSVSVMPASGFWLVLCQGLGMLLQKHAGTTSGGGRKEKA